MGISIHNEDRKSGVEGKSVDTGGRSVREENTQNDNYQDRNENVNKLATER